MVQVLCKFTFLYLKGYITFITIISPTNLFDLEFANWHIFFLLNKIVLLSNLLCDINLSAQLDKLIKK